MNDAVAVLLDMNLGKNDVQDGLLYVPYPTCCPSVQIHVARSSRWYRHEYSDSLAEAFLRFSRNGPAILANQVCAPTFLRRIRWNHIT